MRLFAGLDLPYEMRRNLELLLHLLKPKAHVQWSPVANLHITTNLYFGSTNSAPVNTTDVVKWIRVQVDGETNEYRIPLYQ